MCAEIKVRPLSARALIRPYTESESRTSGDLDIPETAKENPQTGIVVSLGNENDIAVEVEKKVLFPK